MNGIIWDIMAVTGTGIGESRALRRGTQRTQVFERVAAFINGG
jgi:hypothetical protein